MAETAPACGMRLHHIGLVVPEIEPHAARIGGFLGAQLTRSGSDAALGINWCWLENEDPVIIELLCPDPDAAADGPIAAFLASRGPGLHHLSLWADDLDHSLSSCTASGVDIMGLNRDHAGYEEFFLPPKLFGGALWHVFREKTT